MVYCQVYFFKNGGAFKLGRGYFIMSCAKWNGQFVSLLFIISHESIDSFRDGTKVVILKLLAFCRCMAKHSSSCHDNIGTGIGKSCINNKIFLFPAKGRSYSSYIFVEIL